MASSETTAKKFSVKKGKKEVIKKLFKSLKIKDDTKRIRNSNIFKNFQKENKDELSAKEALGRD